MIRQSRRCLVNYMIELRKNAVYDDKVVDVGHVIGNRHVDDTVTTSFTGPHSRLIERTRFEPLLKSEQVTMRTEKLV